MATWKLAICDDDESQLRRTEQALVRFAEGSGQDFSIVSHNGVDAFFASGSITDVDAVFMDIEFDGEPQGIEAAKRINELAPMCQVIYLTNYLQYAVEVYKTDHVWFVLKEQLVQRLPELFEKLALIEKSRRAQVVLTVRDGSVVKVPCASVLYLERRERITRIVTKRATYEVRDKLPDVLAKLPASTFARCHNSYAVNMPYVAEIHASDLVLDGGAKILVSRSYQKRFRERYLDWADAWIV